MRAPQTGLCRFPSFPASLRGADGAGGRLPGPLPGRCRRGAAPIIGPQVGAEGRPRIFLRTPGSRTQMRGPGLAPRPVCAPGLRGRGEPVRERARQPLGRVSVGSAGEAEQVRGQHPPGAISPGPWVLCVWSSGLTWESFCKLGQFHRLVSACRPLAEREGRGRFSKDGRRHPRRVRCHCGLPGVAGSRPVRVGARSGVPVVWAWESGSQGGPPPIPEGAPRSGLRPRSSRSFSLSLWDTMETIFFPL